MGDKTSFITPFFMLLAGAIAAIIMYVRGFELTRMLLGLLVVLVVFYIIGDIARYLYASIRPRIIPSTELEMMVKAARKKGEITGSVVALGDDGREGAEEGVSADGFMSEDAEQYSDVGYTDDEIRGYTDEGDASGTEGYSETEF